MPKGIYQRTKFHRHQLKKGQEKNNQFGNNNPHWKGNKIGYVGLHDWVKTKLLKPSQCQECGVPKKKLDLANKTGIYNRKLKNWWWICRSCHRKFDKRPSPMKGKKRSLESNLKTSKAIKKWWKNRKNT